jgi:hypothetical protein
MATISTNTGESIYKINKWLGLNENPDGDTQLKPGEAAEMINFKITRDGNLQKRPGTRTVNKLGILREWEGAIYGIWFGKIGSTDYTLFAADADIWSYNWNTNVATSVKNASTTIANAETFFFGFDQKVYIMNGSDYLVWDGSALPAGGVKPVTGYIPIIRTDMLYTGIGSAGDQINKLTAQRKVWITGDASNTVFQLPEKPIASVNAVVNRLTGVPLVLTTDYTVNITTGQVTFVVAPAATANIIEITYTATASFRSQITAMKFAEIFNGNTDNRVFIYGDGSNQAFYSGLDSDGGQRADYFPDLNVVNIGEENTPITAMIRHYSQLAVYKTDSAYSVDYGQITLVDGSLTSAFFVVPVNRSIGNIAPGKAQLVNNSPRTLFNSAIYEWHNDSSFASNLTVDERQAKLVSQRVFRTLGSMNLAAAYTYDDNERQEYYVIQNDIMVINNYATDTWYLYEAVGVNRLIAVNGEFYGCTMDGDIVHISRTYQNDNDEPIDCYWRSGSIDFGKGWQSKYSNRIFVTMKPESKAYVVVTVITNKKDSFADKPISYGIFDFFDMDFAHFSFGTNIRPQTARIKIKAKKFAYYQLIFKTDDDWNNATILQAEIKVRYTGDVK